MTTFSAVFFVSFPSAKYPKSTVMMKNVLAFFEFSFLHTKINQEQSGEDVLHKMEPGSLKSLLEKDYKLVCARKYPICIKCPPFLTFLYPLQNNLNK